MKAKSIYFTLLAFVLFGCRSNPAKHDFYTYTKSFDLWRLPLIEPVELISPTNTNDWFLKIKDPRFNNQDFYDPGNEFQLSNIESVGILDSVIVIHSNKIYWPKLSGAYNTTVIIDIKKQKKYIYSDEQHGQQLNEKLNELGITSIMLYPLENLVKSFQANLSLLKDRQH